MLTWMVVLAEIPFSLASTMEGSWVDEDEAFVFDDATDLAVDLTASVPQPPREVVVAPVPINNKFASAGVPTRADRLSTPKPMSGQSSLPLFVQLAVKSMHKRNASLTQREHTPSIRPLVPVPLLTEDQRRDRIFLALWLSRDAAEYGSPTLTVPPVSGDGASVADYLDKQLGKAHWRRHVMRRAARANPLGAAAVVGDDGLSDLTAGTGVGGFSDTPSSKPLYSPLPYIHAPSPSATLVRVIDHRRANGEGRAAAKPGDVVEVEVSLSISSNTATRRVVVDNGPNLLDTAGKIPRGYRTRPPTESTVPAPACQVPPAFHVPHGDEETSRSSSCSCGEEGCFPPRSQGEFYSGRVFQFPLLGRHRAGGILRKAVNGSLPNVTAAAAIQTLRQQQRLFLSRFTVLSPTAPTISHQPERQQSASVTLAAVEEMALGMIVGEMKMAVIPSLLAFGTEGHQGMGIEPLEEGLILSVHLRKITSGVEEAHEQRVPMGMTPNNAQHDAEEEEDTLASMLKNRKAGKRVRDAGPSRKGSLPTQGASHVAKGYSATFTNERHRTVVEQVDIHKEALRARVGGRYPFVKEALDDSFHHSLDDGAAMKMRLASGKRGQTLQYLLGGSVRASSSPLVGRQRKGASLESENASLQFPASTSSYQQHGYNVDRGAHPFFTSINSSNLDNVLHHQVSEGGSSSVVELVVLRGPNSDPLDIARVNRVAEETYYHNKHSSGALATSPLDRILVGDLASVGPLLLGLHDAFGNTAANITGWARQVAAYDSCCEVLDRGSPTETPPTTAALTCTMEHIPADQLPANVLRAFQFCSHSYPLSMSQTLLRHPTAAQVEFEYRRDEGVGLLQPADSYLVVPHGSADSASLWTWAEMESGEGRLEEDRERQPSRTIAFNSTAKYTLHYTIPHNANAPLLNETRNAISSAIAAQTNPIVPESQGVHVFLVVQRSEVSEGKAVELAVGSEVYHVGSVPAGLAEWRRLVSWAEQWSVLVKQVLHQRSVALRAERDHREAERVALMELAANRGPRELSSHIHELKEAAHTLWASLQQTKHLLASVQDSLFTVFDVSHVTTYQNTTTVEAGEAAIRTSDSQGATDDIALSTAMKINDEVTGVFYMNEPYKGLPEGLSDLTAAVSPERAAEYHRSWCGFQRLNDCSDLLRAWDMGAMSTDQLADSLMLDYRGGRQGTQVIAGLKALVSGKHPVNAKELLAANLCPQPFLLFLHSVVVSGKARAVEELKFVHNEVVSRFPLSKSKGWVPLSEDADITSALRESNSRLTPHDLLSLVSQSMAEVELSPEDAKELSRVLTPRLREEMRERVENAEVEYGYTMGPIAESMLRALGEAVI